MNIFARTIRITVAKTMEPNQTMWYTIIPLLPLFSNCVNYIIIMTPKDNDDNNDDDDINESNN